MKKSGILLILVLHSLVFSLNNTYAQSKLIEKGAHWWYFDNGSLDPNWFEKTDFTKWKKGISPIGYGDLKVVTKIAFGPDSDNKEITKYFANTFTLKNKKNILGFEMNFQRDDGIVVYINGKEVYRNNMPKGNITSTSTARNLIDRDREKVFHTKILNSNLFTEGKNFICVSIHQYSPNSSDCIFNLELIGHKNIKSLTFAINRQLSNKNSLTKKLNQLNNELQIQKNNLQSELLKNTNENLRYTLFIVSILFILSLIGYFFMLYYQEKKQKANNINFIKLKNLNFDKEKELLTLSTRLLHNRQSFKELKTEIKGIKTDDKSAIKSMIQQIDFLLDKDQDWKILEKHFNEVHSGFYDRIIKLHPSLTETELRHCLFIKLHMQTKEIARILLIDPRSVQTARYRIKKKMNLDENIDLREYLLKI